MTKILKSLLSFILLGAFLFGTASLAGAQTGEGNKEVVVYFFWGDGCPHCAAQKPFLADLAARYPEIEVRAYEVWSDTDNLALFFEMAEANGFEPQAVPTTFIGHNIWTGWREDMKADMEATVKACLERGCPDPGAFLSGEGEVQSSAGQVEQAAPADPLQEEALLAIPLIGTINLNAQSLPFSTAVIAFVDGFNPCSLWVLSILLALVIHTGSRRKVLLVGLTFLLVTAGVYGIFIAGLFKVFTVVSFMGWIQVAVALLALVFALINIKDYFWYKKGISFTISDKHKPKIYRDFRGLLNSEKSVFALIGATVVMALGIALVELPCTAGFPVLWTKIVSAHQVSTLNFVLLLGLYMLIYLLDELLFFFTAVVTLRASKMEEKQGRVLKLVGGMVMLALALVLLINPELMNSFASSLIVFAGAFGATGLVLLLHRLVLPRFGIVIGSEDEGAKKPRRRAARLS
jgi:thiol-disulfide isomerase/thioredoxin